MTTVTIESLLARMSLKPRQRPLAKEDGERVIDAQGARIPACEPEACK
jgi:hypothetical protein